MNGMSPGRPPGPCVSISRWADLRVAIRHYSLLASSYELGLGPPACSATETRMDTIPWCLVRVARENRCNHYFDTIFLWMCKL